MIKFEKTPFKTRVEKICRLNTTWYKKPMLIIPHKKGGYTIIYIKVKEK